MAEEGIDVDEMLEATFKEKVGGDSRRDQKSKSSDKDRDDKRENGHKKSKRGSRSKSRDKKRSRSRSGEKDKKREERDRREKRRSRSKDRRSPDRRHRSRSRERSDRFGGGGGGGGGFGGGGRRGNDRPYRPSYRPPSPYRRRSPPTGFTGRRMPGPERRDVMPFAPRCTPPKNAKRLDELTPEERDARTIFCMQLTARVRPRDLEDFFSSVGKVRDVRIITDSKTKRSKGIAYIEFYDSDPVPLALGLNGQRLCGAPLVIQPTQSEKNRLMMQQGSSSFTPAIPNHGPMKLYVGSLHFNITEEMLRGIFEPFGRIDSIQLLKDPETDRSRGYAFVTFHNADDAKRAMEQLNGFELAGRAMKVGHVTEHTPSGPQARLDSDEMDRAGIDLGTTGRLQLMAKLAEGTGMQLPLMAQQMLQVGQQQAAQQTVGTTPAIATQCFMLSNMFDPAGESGPDWEYEIRDDVVEECNKHGGILHIFVDKASPQGNVYCKCPTISAAVNSVNSLHGRWFAGKIITANYVPVPNYHQLFPDAMSTTTLLQPSK